MFKSLLHLLVAFCALSLSPSLLVVADISCPPNSHIQLINGVEVCQLCIPGYSAGGDSYYCTSGCNTNNFLTTVNHLPTCVACGPHSSSPGVDALTCTCDTGNGFLPNGLTTTGAVACYCPPNNWKVTPTSCIGCPPHAMSPASSTSCTCDTAHGFTQNGVNFNGSPVCYCAPNHFKSTPTTCVACPPHSTSAASSSTCTCNAGYTAVTVNGVVQSCVA